MRLPYKMDLRNFPSRRSRHFIYLKEKSQFFLQFSAQLLLSFATPIWINITQENATCKSSFSLLFYIFSVRLRNWVGFCNFSTFGLLFIVLLRVKKKKMKISSQREKSFWTPMLHNFENYVSLRSGKQWNSCCLFVLRDLYEHNFALFFCWERLFEVRWEFFNVLLLWVLLKRSLFMSFDVLNSDLLWWSMKYEKADGEMPEGVTDLIIRSSSSFSVISWLVVETKVLIFLYANRKTADEVLEQPEEPSKHFFFPTKYEAYCLH